MISKAFSVPAKDPYNLSHEMLHWCQQFGRVEEHKNKVLSSGPRTTSKIEFTLKKHLDKFSVAIVKVYMEGHMALSRLDIRIETSFRSDLPASTGLVMDIFEDYYTQRIFPKLYDVAEKVTEDIVTAFEKRAMAPKIVVK